MKPVIVIPARYESSRFPGKPLAMIAGKSLLERVWEQCCGALPADQVYVATDDDRIRRHGRERGMQVLMTSPDCLTGTDRVAEVARSVTADVYVNVQGDEPLVAPLDIQAVMEQSALHPGEVVHGVCEITSEQDFRSTSVPKVVFAPDSRVLYLSRAPIPTDKGHRFITAWRQVCIYAFPPDALAAFALSARKTTLEEIEDIEVLRFAELGFTIRAVHVSNGSVAVDFPEDIARVERILDERRLERSTHHADSDSPF